MNFLANAINWLECYSFEITIILRVFSKLNNIIIDLYDQIESFIHIKLSLFKNSEEKINFSHIINEAFVLGIESMLNIITSNIDIYQNIINSQDKITQFINISKDILQDSKQLCTNLNMHIKEIYSFEQFIEILEAFNINSIATIENIIKIISYFNLENNIVQDKKKDLYNHLEEFYKFISENINNYGNYHKIMNKILYNEYLKLYDEEYQLQILKIILKDNILIIRSKFILKIAIKKYISNNPSDDLSLNIEKLTDKKSPIIAFLNSINSPILDEILLNVFEGEIIHYFEAFKHLDYKIAEKNFLKFYTDNKILFKLGKEPKYFTGVLFDKSFNTFKILVEHLENIIIRKNNNNLSKLYAISYIKLYLKYFVNYINEKKTKIEENKVIINFICTENICNFRKVLKIYILKLFNNLSENYEQFQNYKFEEVGINFHEEFNLKNKDNNNSNILNYCLMTLDNDNDMSNYNEESINFEILRNNKFLKDEHLLLKNISNFGIDTFICISINRIIINLGYKQLKNEEEFMNFFNFVSKKLNGKYEWNQYLKNLLFLFFDLKKFNEKIKKQISKRGNINTKLFEAILYSFRFCVQSLEALDIKKNNKNNKKYLYASILNERCIDNINDCYIPGNETQEDMHLLTFKYVVKHLNINPDTVGCYVCSCGYYYAILPCGFPNKDTILNCPVCKLKLGYGERKNFTGVHGLFRRPGHMRIFKDENQHKECMERFKDDDENIPNMTLEEYKKEIISPIISKSGKGLKTVTKVFFLERDKKVRKLNELSYRLLNYIVYSHLFFANCLDYIDEQDLIKNCLVQDMKCIDIIEKDWEIIIEILKQRGIQSIQIFMNLIFKRLSELIKYCDYFTESNERDNFEEQIEKVINDSLLEYNNYSIKYIEENNKKLNLNNYNIKTILNELSPPTTDIYSQEIYPLFKYFILTKYNSKEELINKLGPPNIFILKYPLLHQYLLNNVDAKKMKYLPNFNEFTNYMVEYYSFKISRDDAKKRILKSEPIFNEQGFQNKYNNFINCWNEIKGEATKYKCRDKMKPKDLNKDDKLIYFLNDDGELGNGMYLAAACQNFITWQNSFLQPIIDNSSQNGILHYFVKNMKRKIPVQNAKINQILLIEDCFKNSFYYNFEDIIQTFSRRNIFKEDYSINYYNYNSFIFDFDSIEEELGRLLLPGKCLFENEENLNFITFWSEGFQGGKSDTLSNFYLKYPQKNLAEIEKEKIIEYIKSQKNNNFKSFFGSMQLLIFFLSNNLYKNDEKIFNVLKNAPKYLNISENCYSFFEKEGKEFKLEKLMNIFFFIEHLCFKELSETLQQEYKMKIDEKLSKQIKERLLSNKHKNESITVGKFAAALRRYISRYLVGKRDSIEVDEKRDLSFELSRIDLWDICIGKLVNLDELIASLIGEFKLKVGQAYEFYKIIEDEDKII